MRNLFVIPIMLIILGGAYLGMRERGDDRIRVEALIEERIAGGQQNILDRSGDLNGDGIEDRVLVFEQDNEDRDRELVVLYGVGRGNFTIVAESSTAVPCMKCNGYFESFPDVELTQGEISISYNGGSPNNRLFDKDIYRLIEGRWVLYERVEEYFEGTPPDDKLVKTRHRTRADFGTVLLVDKEHE